MNLEQAFLVALLVGVFGLFLWGRLRHDVVAFLALMAAVVAGTIPADQAFSGFGHPATITVAAVLVISRALQNSGAVDLIARVLLPPISAVGRQIAVFSGVAGALSAVMNNVGALALLMPAALQSSGKAGHSPAAILMPLSFGAILGGMLTLIGTPPNVIVANIRAEAMGEPFGMFAFTPVGGAVAIVGVLFVATIGWRLIPGAREKRTTAKELFDIEDYVTEGRIPKDSPANGMAGTELEENAAKHDVQILAVIRGDRRIGRAELQRATLKTSDVIVFEAAPAGLTALRDSLKLDPVGRAKDDPRSWLSGGERVLMEAVVAPNGRVDGRTLNAARPRGRLGAVILAVSRQGKAIRGRLGDFRLRAGDVLLLEGEAEGMPDVLAHLGCLPLAERGLQADAGRRTGLSIGCFGAAVAAASVGLLPLPIALALAATVMVVLEIVTPRELYDAVDWPVIVLLGAMIPIGGALEAAGVTALIADALVAYSAGLSAVVVLTLILAVTMTLSDILNNAATTVVMAPISLGVAERLSVNPDAFLMAVAIGASCAFLTPIGHQNNTLVMGPGGYRFGDYWRMGLPLEILVIAVSVPMLLWVWPL